MVENIRHEGKIVARIIRAEELDGPFKFFGEDHDALQISRWNHPKGYRCQAHIHRVTNKQVPRTQEAIILIRGELKVRFYTMDGHFITERLLYPLDICHSMDCGHGYEVLTEDTRVIEVKNGPFLGEKNYDLERMLIDWDGVNPWDDQLMK